MAFTKKAKTFHRETGQRSALIRSLARSLVLEERISTTEAKAKALRPYIERLVSRIHDKEAVKKLFGTIGPRYADRKGGYTRIVKRTLRCSNDARKLAYIAFV